MDNAGHEMGDHFAGAAAVVGIGCLAGITGMQQALMDGRFGDDFRARQIADPDGEPEIEAWFSTQWG